MVVPGCQIFKSQLISAEARMEPVLCGTQQGSSHHHQLEIPTPLSQTIPVSKTNCSGT